MRTINLKPFERIFFIFALLLLANISINAQSRFKSAEDSAKCILQSSLYDSYSKQKNYGDALAPWTIVYSEFPWYSKNIYIYGVQIVKWQYSQAKTAAEKQVFLDKLLEVYNQRIKYFGNDPKFPTSLIYSSMALDFYQYDNKNTETLKKVYNWLGISIESLKENSSVRSINVYLATAFALFANNEMQADELIKRYQDLSSLLDLIQKNNPDNKDVVAVKDVLESNFASSGVADCATMERLFGPKIEGVKAQKEELNKIIGLFEKTNCTESENYYKASEYLHAIEPSASSARGVANMYVKREDFAKALAFYQEASTLETDPIKKSKDLYLLAALTFSKLKDFSKARAFALESASVNPAYGDPYILIGTMYAQAAQERKLGTKDIENQAAYWAAVDKFSKAAQIDPAKKEDAQNLINSYSKFFPGKEELFFDPDYKEGALITVGGWIQERTVVRAKKQ